MSKEIEESKKPEPVNVAAKGWKSSLKFWTVAPMPKGNWKAGLKFSKVAEITKKEKAAKPKKDLISDAGKKVRAPIRKVSKTNAGTVRKLSAATVGEVMKRDGFACVICGSRKDLECHHVFFGSEANRWEDRNEPHQLAMLCRECHYDVHSKGDTEKREQAKAYLREIVNTESIE